MIMITGGSGFLGRHIIDSMASHDLVLLQRKPQISPHKVVVSKLSEHGDYTTAMEGVTTVIHAAGMAHQMKKKGGPTDDDYLKVNSCVTERLAESAKAAGVSHFIFISSVKVNGEHTYGRGPFVSDDIPDPRDGYARSKRKAEEMLFAVESDSDMTVSVVRAPLIYGPGVKANFGRLLRFSSTGIPFPKSSSAGLRSLVSVWNLCSFISHIADNPPDVSAVYMVSDGTDCTTFDLLKYVAQADNRQQRGISFPQKLLYLIARLLGQGEKYDKLFKSLRVDISRTLEQTGWAPGHCTRQGLARLVSETRKLSHN